MQNNYGRRLIHHEAERNPLRTFAVVAKSDKIESGFTEVNFQQVARAVNYVSHWLQTRFESGAKPPRHATLTYIGVPDLRYNIIFYAAVQCRYKVFLPSPRNPTAVNVSLLEQTQCSRFVYSIEVAPVAKAICGASPGMHCEEFPNLDELLASTPTNYPYDLEYMDVYREPILILHSSGSTGAPKPIVNTHGTFATYDVRDWPTVPGRVNHDGLSTLRFPQSGSRIYDVFPPFHIAGFMTKIMVPLYNLTVAIFGPPLRPPTGALTAEMIRFHKPRGAVIPPSITEQLYHEYGGASLFKQLDVLLFGGGPLPQAVGDEISKHTTLCQFYGWTEMGQIRQLIPHPEDWSYIQFHPNEKFELQPAGEDIFELVVFSDKDLERTSSLYHNYPGLREWRTKDLFKPHPSKPYLWKFHARKDDILVFSSGEKLNPIPMESYMMAVSSVSGALVVGQGYPQASLLLELSQNEDSPHGPEQMLWPEVEKANALLPGHGQIARSMIIIADPKKPFARAGKGAVVRRLTEDLYASEIKRLYETTFTEPIQISISCKLSSFAPHDLEPLIRSVLTSVSVDHQMGIEENLYTQGMDSVKTTEAIGLLKATFLKYKSKSELSWISGETLYLNPTIRQLSSVFVDFLNKGHIPKKGDRVAEMEAKIKEYSGSLPRNMASMKTEAGLDKFSVAITGTTGHLGGHLLAKLAKVPHITRIYCLNRSTKAQQNFEKRNPQIPTNKMKFLHASLASPDLGLRYEEYTQLSQHCNIIIHNAWRVDFNLTLDSFEDNLQSVKQLVQLSAASPLRPRICFISSISSTGVFAPAGSPPQIIREHIVDNLSLTMDIGNAESKHVAEHILHAATSQAAIPTTIIRMGQLSPSSNLGDGSAWPQDDVVSVLLRTCKAIRCLPSDFVDTMNWVPVDQAAAVVSVIVQYDIQGTEVESVSFYNVVHPKPQPWAAVIGDVQEWCGPGTQIVNMQKLVQKLREMDANDRKIVDRFPALRMLQIYDIMAKRGPTHEYVMKRLMVASGIMGELAPVDARLLSL